MRRKGHVVYVALYRRVYKRLSRKESNLSILRAAEAQEGATAWRLSDQIEDEILSRLLY